MEINPDNEWKLVIYGVQNGYILEGKFGDGDVVTQVVIEENEEVDKKEAMKKLLLEVKNYFAGYYDKHDKENVVVEIEGRKDK